MESVSGLERIHILNDRKKKLIQEGTAEEEAEK
jgi:hypothetical protein